MKPRTLSSVPPTFAPQANSYRLSPAIDTSQVGGNNPNDYSAHVVQSVFQDDMWTAPDYRVLEFAYPVILMFASEHMAVAELTSGVGKTRTSDDNTSEDLRQREAKTVIGHLSQGILTRGGTTYDLFSAIGSVFVGSGGRYNGDSCESFDEGPDPVPGCTPITGDPGPGYDYHQARMTKIQGPESCVQMGKRITADSAPGADGNRALLGPVDWRHQTWHEDDYWAPCPGVVEYMIATDCWAQMDNRKVDTMVYHPPMAPGASVTPGYIHEAIGIQANIRGYVENSYISIQKGSDASAIGIYSETEALGVFDHACELAPGKSDRPGSVIRDFMGLEVCPPIYGEMVNGTPVVSVGSATAMTIWTTPQPTGIWPFPTPTPASKQAGNGAEEAEIDSIAASDEAALANGAQTSDARAAGANDSSAALSSSAASAPSTAIAAAPAAAPASMRGIERFATLIARGSVVVGDGQTAPDSPSGVDTDALRVNGVIRLRPRLSPPVFSEKTPPCDRVGVIYYDLTRNCPRISLAAPRKGLTRADWKEAEIVWVDLKFNLKNFNPKTDVKGARPGKASLANASKEEVLAAMERAKARAKDGTSIFLKSHAELQAMQSAK